MLVLPAVLKPSGNLLKTDFILPHVMILKTNVFISEYVEYVALSERSSKIPG